MYKLKRKNPNRPSSSNKGRQNDCRGRVAMPEPDHYADQREALDIVRAQPECTVQEVADTPAFEGSRARAFRALNAMRNAGILQRREDRYTFDPDAEVEV